LPTCMPKNDAQFAYTHPHPKDKRTGDKIPRRLQVDT